MPNAVRMEQPVSAPRKFLDWKLGFLLMTHGGVPLLCKLIAVALGIMISLVLGAIELPIEEVLAAVLSIFGVAGDLAVDGLEIVFLPLLILPFVVPSQIVERIRAKHGPASVASKEKPIIDI